MDTSTRIVRSALVIAGNIFVAVSAFCGAFVLAIADLPEAIAILGVSATVGIFVAYGSVIATLLVFCNSRLPLRLLVCCASFAASIYLIFICFGAMNEFAGIATHFFGIVMVALLWLGLLQNTFGWKIQRAGCKTGMKPRGQIDLWVLFVWTLGFALLSTVLRSDSVTTESLMGTGLAALLTTSTTFAVTAMVLRRMNFFMSSTVLLLLLVVSICAEVYFLNSVLRGIPALYCTTMVSSANIGGFVAALGAAVSLRLLDYHLISAPTTVRESVLQNQGIHPSRVG